MDQNRLFAALSLGVPPEVERLYQAGNFEAANARIDVLLNAGRLPGPAKDALLALRQIMRRIPDHYNLDRDAAVALLQKEIPGFAPSEFDALVEADRVDWRYVGGKRYYLDRFAEALRLYPDMQARGMAPSPDTGVLDKVLAAMHAHGGAGARITVRASVGPDPALAAADPDAELLAWLPIPAACAEQSEIEILDAPKGTEFAPTDAEQRTAFWRGRAGDGPFTVTYRYHIQAGYRDMDALVPDAVQPCFCLGEQAPHIRFTPWLRALCAGITAGCTDNLQKARAIYDYVTTNTNYRYQPAYACLTDIADNCAKSGWGDCGIMALLFITLCRIAGVPARWQSGLYVTPWEASCHDWAQFYIAPYGWLWADCSFGSSAHRRGDEARRRHYFGNLDPLRMVANREYYAQVTPPDQAWRNDPYDNQTGEAVLAGRGLYGDALHTRRTVVDFQADWMDPDAR